jgi:hypothetical protein
MCTMCIAAFRSSTSTSSRSIRSSFASLTESKYWHSVSFRAQRWQGLLPSHLTCAIPSQHADMAPSIPTIYDSRPTFDLRHRMQALMARRLRGRSERVGVDISGFSCEGGPAPVFYVRRAECGEDPDHVPCDALTGPTKTAISGQESLCRLTSEQRCETGIGV